jgi:hypothetical protein
MEDVGGHKKSDGRTSSAECEADSRSIVWFGDSITDGFGSTVDGNAR